MTHNGGHCQQKAQDGAGGVQTAAHTGTSLSPFQPFAYLHLNANALKVPDWAPVLKDEESDAG